MDKNITEEANDFLSSYIAGEFSTWQSVHSIEDYAIAEKAISEFESKYFSESVFSDISRPGTQSSIEFLEYSQLISTKRTRKIYCIYHFSDNIFRAVLGSTYIGNDEKFEIIQFEKVEKFAITSQYYTNFDGTFSHAGGKDLGEIIDDPCPYID